MFYFKQTKYTIEVLVSLDVIACIFFVEEHILGKYTSHEYFSYWVTLLTIGMKLSEAEERQLVTWENMNADEYLRKTHDDEKESMENKVKDTSERLDSDVSSSFVLVCA